MRAFIILALVAAAAADVSHLNRASARSGGPESEAVILKQNNDVNVDGFQQEFETSNGIATSAQGQIKNAGREDEALSVQGEVVWTADDGTPMQLSYIADENGYQPKAAHIPTPPPIPAAIARALEYIAAHPPPPETGNQQRRF